MTDRPKCETCVAFEETSKRTGEGICHARPPGGPAWSLVMDPKESWCLVHVTRREFLEPTKEIGSGEPPKDMEIKIRRSSELEDRAQDIAKKAKETVEKEEAEAVEAEAEPEG